MPPKYDKLLILDLDETLVYSTEEPLLRNPDFKVFEYHVYKRPGLDYFLSVCTAWFETAIWTASGYEYAHQVIRQIFPETDQLKFIFTSKQCTLRLDYELGSYYVLKRLKKVKKKGYPLEKVLIVDDSPEKSMANYGNAIPIQKYEGKEEDCELSLLLKYLEIIGSQENVRQVEKRRWRAKVLKSETECGIKN